MKNRARAMQILRNKLFDMELQKQQEDIRSRRKDQVLCQKLKQCHHAGTHQSMAPQSYQGMARTGMDGDCVGRVHWMDMILYGKPLPPCHAEAACCTEAGPASFKQNRASPCIHACTAII